MNEARSITLSADPAVAEPGATRRDSRSSRAYLALYLTAIVVLAIDQVTKYLTRLELNVGQSVPFIGPLQLTHVQNTGAAFGILPNQTVFLGIVAVIVSAVIVVYGSSLRTRSAVLRIALGLQLGGAVGNLIDRIHQGHVTDMFDLRNAEGINIWPVFNIADSAIVTGVVLLAVYLIVFDRKPAASPPAPERSTPLTPDADPVVHRAD